MGDLGLILSLFSLNMSNDMQEVAESVTNLVLSGCNVSVKHGMMCIHCKGLNGRRGCRYTGEECQFEHTVTISSKKTFVMK